MATTHMSPAGELETNYLVIGAGATGMAFVDTLLQHADRDVILLDRPMPPPNYLPALTGPPSGFTVIGAGKTAMDTALWLLDQGVAPESIRWIRPRDAWLTERGCVQPLDLAVQSMVWAARTLEASAQARDMADLFRRLQEAGCSRRSTRR